jgi:hypothetical protein
VSLHAAAPLLFLFGWMCSRSILIKLAIPVLIAFYKVKPGLKAFYQEKNMAQGNELSFASATA